jgi:hypothetical protein
MYNLPPPRNPKPLAKQLRAIEEFICLKPRQRVFLLAFAATGSIYRGAEKVGLSWANHYKWLHDPNYSKAFEKAGEMYADFAEGDVMMRAFEGEEHTIIKANGEIQEKYRKKSDILAMFALKKMRPAYRDNPQLSLTVNNHPPQIHFNIINDLAQGAPSATAERPSSDDVIDLDDLRSITNKDK